MILRKLFKRKSIFVGMTILASFAISGAFAPWIAPYQPNVMNASAILDKPSPRHIFGTDDFGRDVFSRVIFGARTSLLVGVAVTLTSGFFGTIIALFSAYYKSLDNIIMRAIDISMAFPVIILAIAIMAILGPSELNAIIAISVVYTPWVARVVRSQALAVIEESFVEAAQAMGSNNLHILGHHILLNCWSALLVQLTVIFAYAILVEAALSFLGLGTPPPAPSWGNILNESRNYLTTAPWVSISSGAVISITVLAINLIGDGLRDILDPKMRSR